jgi:uncharacterized protein (TIGR02596 family)
MILKPTQSERNSIGTVRGFSLIELLAVILIIGLLVAASAPYYQGSMVALRLATDGAQVESMLSAAQQAASSQGRNVEVRFYKYASPEQMGGERFRSIVLLRYYQVGEADPDPRGTGVPLAAPLAVVIGDAHTLSPGIVLSEQSSMSPLLGNQTAPGSVIATKAMTKTGLTDWEFSVPGASYRSFVIRPEGTSLDPRGKWFVTAVSARDEEGDPAAAKNFYCVQIDPGNGRVTSYRP